MARSFLFGGNQPSSQMKYLVEFRAGKMQVRDNMVTPTKKKGLVYLNQADDNLMHFCWKDRTTGTVEDDLIIFPDDAEFKRVAQCKTGRVYVLKFKSSSRRCFYWMQEPSEDKDDEFCKKVNDFLNNPPAPGSRSGGSGGSGLSAGSLAELGNLQEQDLHSLFNTVNPQQLMQMLSSAGGINSPGLLAGLLNQAGSSRSSHSTASSSHSTATPTSSQANSTGKSSAATSASTTHPVTPATSGSTTDSGAGSASGAAGAGPAGIQLSDLQNIITGLSVDPSKKEEVGVSLAAALNSDALKTLLGNGDFMQRVREFLPTAGESPASKDLLPEQLTSTVQSPQFRAALNTFNSAFQLGSLGPLMSQFNLGQGCIDAAERGDLDAFIKAMEDAEKKPVETVEKDSDMALD